MPAWAFTKRVEDITPAFDVFSLGKLLWAMVSGRPVLNLWYFDRPEYNLADMFPDSPSIGLANPLLGKCIVEHEDAQGMIDALQHVADLNHILIEKHSWRHGSIAWRQRYLRSLVGRSVGQLPIDRQMRWINVPLKTAARRPI